VHRYVKLLLVAAVVTSAAGAAVVPTVHVYTRLLLTGDAAIGAAVSTRISPSIQLPDVGLTVTTGAACSRVT
jgi:hypothetical protein